MPEESPIAKPVEMVTAKYLDQRYLADETAANAVPTDSHPQGKSALESITRGISVCVVGAMIVIVPMTASSAYTEMKAARAKNKCSCRSAGDWLLWCSGSKRTFNDHIRDKFDECQRAMTQPRSPKDLGFEPSPSVPEFKMNTQPWLGVTGKVQK